MYQLICIMPPIREGKEPDVIITSFRDDLEEQASKDYASSLMEAKDLPGMYVYLVKSDTTSQEVLDGGIAIEMLPLSQFKSRDIIRKDYFKMSAADDADIQI